MGRVVGRVGWRGAHVFFVLFFSHRAFCVLAGAGVLCVCMSNEYRKTIHKYWPPSARLEKQYPIAWMHAPPLETGAREIVAGVGEDSREKDERGGMQVNNCRCQGGRGANGGREGQEN